jgi:hypothetical protein
MYREAPALAPSNHGTFGTYKRPKAHYQTPGMNKNLTHPQGRFSVDNAYKWFYLIGLKGGSFIGALLAVVMSLILFVKLKDDCGTAACRNKLHMTTTYLLTSNPEVLNAWPVATSRDSGISASALVPDVTIQYYECMYNSYYASASCNSLQTYPTCLQGLSATVSSALVTCLPNATQYGFLPPTAYQFTSCMNAALAGGTVSLNVTRANINAMSTCLRGSLAPVYEVPLPIDSRHVLGSYNWVLVLLVGFWCYTSFAVATGWPFDYEQKWTYLIDGKPVYAGSRFSWLWWLIGFVWNALLFGFVLAAAFRASSGGVASSFFDANYPTSASTTIITMIFSFYSLYYFITQLADLFIWANDKTLRDFRDNRDNGAARVIQNGFRRKLDRKKENRFEGVDYNAAMPSTIYPQLGMTLPDAENIDYVSADTLAEDVTPYLSFVWADAQIFDALILVGFIGATGQVNTADIDMIFFSMVAVTVASRAVANLMAKGYVKDHYLDQSVQDRQAKPAFKKFMGQPENVDTDKGYENITYEVGQVRHMGALVQLALFALLYQVYNVTAWDSMRQLYTFSLVSYFVWFSYIVPEVFLKGGGHLVMYFSSFNPMGVMSSQHFGVFWLTVSHMAWVWGLLTKTVFLFILITDASSDGVMRSLPWQNHHYNDLLRPHLGLST